MSPNQPRNRNEHTGNNDAGRTFNEHGGGSVN